MAESMKYDYAVGRIAYLETKALNKGIIERMLMAPNAYQACQMLSECGMPSVSQSEQGTEKSVRDYIRNLEKYETAFLNELKTFVPETEIVDLFLVKRDLSNFKICIKNCDNFDFAVELLSKDGLIDSNKLVGYFKSEHFEALPKVFANVLPELLSKYRENRLNFELDTAIDKLWFDYARYVVTKVGLNSKQFLRKYINLLAVNYNLMSTVRIIKAGRAGKLLEKSYVECSVPQHTFSKVISTFPEGFTDLFKTLGLEDKMATQIEYFIGREAVQPVAVKLDDIEIEFLRDASISKIGVERVLYFIVSRLREIKNARMILTGKMSELQVSVIREEIRKAGE